MCNARRTVMTGLRGTRPPGGKSLNTLRKYKHAILLAALLWVALIESFSHQQVLGPIASELFIITVLMLVFLIVFHRIPFAAWGLMGARQRMGRSPGG